MINQTEIFDVIIVFTDGTRRVFSNITKFIYKDDAKLFLLTSAFDSMIAITREQVRYLGKYQDVAGNYDNKGISATNQKAEEQD